LDELQNPGLNIFAQENNFIFDPSMVGIYASCLPSDNISPVSIPTDKVEKQRMLLQMKEATRRLEAEIAAS
jgi:hypothetical protein